MVDPARVGPEVRRLAELRLVGRLTRGGNRYACERDEDERRQQPDEPARQQREEEDRRRRPDEEGDLEGRQRRRAPQVVEGRERGCVGRRVARHEPAEWKQGERRGDGERDHDVVRRPRGAPRSIQITSPRKSIGASPIRSTLREPPDVA